MRSNIKDVQIWINEFNKSVRKYLFIFLLHKQFSDIFKGNKFYI